MSHIYPTYIPYLYRGGIYPGHIRLRSGKYLPLPWLMAYSRQEVDGGFACLFKHEGFSPTDASCASLVATFSTVARLTRTHILSSHKIRSPHMRRMRRTARIR